jgi:hypothetical protein
VAVKAVCPSRGRPAEQAAEFAGRCAESIDDLVSQRMGDRGVPVQQVASGGIGKIDRSIPFIGQPGQESLKPGTRRCD